MKVSRRPRVVAILAALTVATCLAAQEVEPKVEGVLNANGKVIDLPYVYVYAEGEGFYEKSDPTWKVVFAAEPIDSRDLDSSFFGFPYVQIGLTLTSEFEGEPTLDVYSQDLRLDAEAGNISGGTYPEIAIDRTGPEVFSGRIHQVEEQEFFDNRYQYDFTFSAPLSDPNAPIGEPLPADGGEPGAAYRTWMAAIRALDLDRLKTLVPADQAEMLLADDAMETVEMLRDLSPEGIDILGGSSDGETAILQVRGTMDGEAVTGEVTLQRIEGHWIPVGESWE